MEFWILVSGMIIVWVGGYLAAASLFLKTCSRCRLRIVRRATRCPYCHSMQELTITCG